MIRQQSQLWQWLSENGYTDAGEEKLNEGKQIYKRLYQKLYQRKRRKERPSVLVSLSPTEYEQLHIASGKHNTSLAPFIRESALAYLNQSFLVPDEEKLIAFQKHIALLEYDLRKLTERADLLQEETLSRSYLRLAKEMSLLSDRLEVAVRQPQTLSTSFSKSYDHKVQNEEKSKLPPSD